MAPRSKSVKTHQDKYDISDETCCLKIIKINKFTSNSSFVYLENVAKKYRKQLMILDKEVYLKKIEHVAFKTCDSFHATGAGLFRALIVYDFVSIFMKS